MMIIDCHGAALTRLGRTAEAQEAMALLLSRNPGFTVGDFRIGVGTKTNLIEKMHAALREAGVPDD